MRSTTPGLKYLEQPFARDVCVRDGCVALLFRQLNKAGGGIVSSSHIAP